jgi:hypothetical protein
MIANVQQRKQDDTNKKGNPARKKERKGREGG